MIVYVVGEVPSIHAEGQPAFTWHVRREAAVLDLIRRFMEGDAYIADGVVDGYVERAENLKDVDYTLVAIDVPAEVCSKSETIAEWIGANAALWQTHRVSS